MLHTLDGDFYRFLKAPLGDFRDWDRITSWATAIADAMKEAVS
jgi:hypothetical protein